MANNEATAPKYTAPDGRFSADYRSHNGLVILGQGEWTFRTQWTTAGNGSIHAYNENDSRIAVAPHARAIEEVNAELFVSADFTSRVRTPAEGEILLLQNQSGYAAAIKIEQVRVTAESQPGTRLAASYRILTDKSRDFSKEVPTAQLALIRTTEDALTELKKLQPNVDDEVAQIGLGHNQPPKDAALDLVEYSELIETLQGLQSLEQAASTKDVLERAKVRVSSAVKAIIGWSAARIGWFEEAFWRGLGSLTAAGLVGTGGWLVVSGKLTAVLGAIAEFARTLVGLG